MMSNSVSARGTKPEGSGSSGSSRKKQGPAGSPSALVTGGDLLRPNTTDSSAEADTKPTNMTDKTVESSLVGLSQGARDQDEDEAFWR
jgi:hypothetical protein